MNYKEALDFLYNRLPMYQRIGAKAFKKDLGNTIELSRITGDPHNQFKSIHIAGTNGKGSSAHAIASILQEAGYKTGLYTSPHLKSYRERIRINGAMISEDFVAGFVSNYENEILKISPSFFEITVVMAFEYFAKENVDIAVIETGLGGRLDSTNIIKPLVSLITTIGKDHEDLLGNTLDLIAYEKAGIIKKGIPVVLGDIMNRPKEVIRKQAALMNAPLNDAGNGWEVVIDKDGFYDLLFQNKKIYESVDPDLKGEYFLKNIPPVLEVIKELNGIGFDLNASHVKNGLENICSNTGLKGRWQQLSDKPLTICDIGHNEDGIAQVVGQLKKIEYRKLHIVFGTVNDKLIDNIMALLIKDAYYYFCAAKVPRALPVEELYEIATKYGLEGQQFNSVGDALQSARNNAQSEDVIFIGGSTFVVAEIENL
ncbi:folylpolyglutamate synthase/dihydrofolate synthase family protein [Reichenbachiella sp. MALMAid0571]|uniref:bifunctional folylpolyglutamate synthase/dihydrofolate synthase n=1 Tax=Reichenbachiella sp. MALMAid0571 TaxID=3143939 RepID=UPI0032DF9938